MSDMKTLFLDDMEERHVAFEKKHGSNFEITHVYGYEDCVAALQSEKFDMLFLDHDLSLEAIMCDPNDPVINELTGTDVALRIVQMMDPADAPGIVVHSLNPAGRKKMVEILKNAGFEAIGYPFTLLC